MKYGTYEDKAGQKVDVRVGEFYVPATIVTPSHDVMNEYDNPVTVTTVKLFRTAETVDIETGLVSAQAQ